MDPSRFLPLKPDVLLILTALAEGETYGYALMQRVHVLSGARVQLQAGALYRRLRTLVEAELIAELEERAVDSTDERRRYYALTKLGRAVVAAETSRLRGLIAVAERGLLPEQS